jgi:hypothetical protein
MLEEKRSMSCCRFGVCPGMLQDGRAGNYQEDQRCQLRSSSTTSTSDVKIDQSPSRSSITHDEFAKMIHKFF